MGFWSKLAKIGSIAGAGLATAFTGGAASPWLVGALGAAGAGLGAASQASASNRGTQIDVGLTQQQLQDQATRDWYNELVQQAQTGDSTRANAWKDLLHAAYVKNWVQPASGVFSPYTKPLTPPSADAKAGANGVIAEAMNRLNNGNPIPTPTKPNIVVDPKLMKPSVWEELSGALGPALTAYAGATKRGTATPGFNVSDYGSNA